MTRENDMSENLNERLQLIDSDAVFSDCRKYRYALWRKWQMEHYERNKEALRKVARDRYRKKRQEEIAEDRRKKLYGE